MAKKEVFIIRGRAIWPHLHAPDKKFKKEFGEFRIKVAVPEADAQAHIERIESLAREKFAEAKKEFEAKNKGKTFEKQKAGKFADKPYQEGDGEDAGMVIFNVKAPAGGKKKDSDEIYTRQIAVFDAKRQPLPKGTRVGGGSEVKVAYSLNPFATAIGVGVSIRLEAVQVLDLKTFERDAKSYGFEEEEGFFVNEGEDGEATDEVEETPAEESEADAPQHGADF